MRITVGTKLVGLVLLVLALMVVAMVTIANISVTDMRESLQQDSVSGAQEMALQIARTLDAGIGQSAQIIDPKYMQAIVDRNVQLRTQDATKIVEFRVHAPDPTSSVGYRAIASNNPENLNEESDPEDIEAIKNDKVVVLQENDEGLPILDVTVPLHADGKAIATAGIKVSLDELQRQNELLVTNTTNRIWTAAGTIGVIALLVSVVLAYLLAMSVVRPIAQLRNVAEKVSMGDLDVSVNVTQNDEIGDLAESFSRMVTAVRFFAADGNKEK